MLFAHSILCSKFSSQNLSNNEHALIVCYLINIIIKFIDNIN